MSSYIHLYIHAFTRTHRCVRLRFLSVLVAWMHVDKYIWHPQAPTPCVGACRMYVLASIYVSISVPCAIAIGIRDKQRPRWQSVIPSTNHWLIIGTGGVSLAVKCNTSESAVISPPPPHPRPRPPLLPRLPNIACQRGEEFWVREIRLWRGPVDGALSRFPRRECIPLSKWHLYLTPTSASISF